MLHIYILMYKSMKKISLNLKFKYLRSDKFTPKWLSSVLIKIYRNGNANILLSYIFINFCDKREPKGAWNGLEKGRKEIQVR